MAYEPAYLEVNPHAINPKKISEGLDLSEVCGWIREKKGDPRYSGRSGTSSQVKNSSNSTLEITLDEAAADGGETRSQDKWIAYFNQRSKGMVSMPDLYLAGKSNNQKLLDGLRADFKQPWIVTSTRIEYRDEFNAKIIHNYGSALIQPVEHKVRIPEYYPQYLAAVLDTNEGLRYLQVLFGTSDSAQQIKDTLQKLNNCSSDVIKVWSAARSARPTERAAGFEIFNYQFQVNGYYIDSLPGCSRGVRL